MHEDMEQAMWLLEKVIHQIEHAPYSRTLAERKEQVQWLNQVCYLVTTTKENNRFLGDLK
jgi:FPC/CPF motif-containing protein YcgG